MWEQLRKGKCLIIHVSASNFSGHFYTKLDFCYRDDKNYKTLPLQKHNPEVLGEESLFRSVTDCSRLLPENLDLAKLGLLPVVVDEDPTVELANCQMACASFWKKVLSDKLLCDVDDELVCMLIRKDVEVVNSCCMFKVLSLEG